ncbi:MAG: hypothetical protein WEB30_10785 [Cyclobacteriaceae bacterium]
MIRYILLYCGKLRKATVWMEAAAKQQISFFGRIFYGSLCAEISLFLKTGAGYDESNNFSELAVLMQIKHADLRNQKTHIQKDHGDNKRN